MMNDFNEDMSKILGIYNCEKFTQLLEDIYELVVLYNVDESDDWVSDIVGDSNTREIRLARTCYLLSRLSERHANTLKRVNRVAPAFWQRAEKLTKPLGLNVDQV